MHRNFNVGFSSHKNDIQLHLSQWQYWWWFWFALIWSLYFLVMLRAALLGTENFKPTVNTSLRSHGKWGDFVVSLIPLSWCGNILINSNFILRMIEWQNESSLFVVRVQGKQWYWVYKYNSDTNYRLQNVYINVGNNNWYKTSNSGSTEFNTHNSTLVFLYEYEFRKVHKSILDVKGKLKSDLSTLTFNSHFTKKCNNKPVLTTHFNTSVSEPFNIKDSLSLNLDELFTIKINKHRLNEIILKNTISFKFQYDWDSYLKKNLNEIMSEESLNLINKLNSKEYLFSFTGERCEFFKEFNTNIKLSYPTSFSIPYNLYFISKLNLTNIRAKDYLTSLETLNSKPFNSFNLENEGNIELYENDRLEDVEETSENLRTKVSNFPVKLVRGVLNKHNVNLLSTNSILSKNILFSYQLNNDQIVEKISQIEQFWGFRQKKYKKLRSFTFSQNYKFNNKTYQSIESFTGKENFNKYSLYNSEKNNKSKSEDLPVTLARRLLRTKRTLILPAHINITIIASSYDVVHSWFIPGLGLKIDCVPGRSNHLTLYIDNIGFYYGQCAEICGRYHHHMPIRVCALNYEQFLLWWQTKGLPRMYRSPNFTKKKSILLSKFK